MKYIALYITCIAFALSFYQADAQSPAFGVFAGDNLNAVRQNFPALKAEIGFYNAWHVGAFYRFRIMDKLSLSADLEYVEKGYLLSRVQFAQADTQVFVQKDQYRYIILRPSLVYYLSNRVSLWAGPYFGAMVDEKYSAYDYLLNNNRITSNPKSSVNSGGGLEPDNGFNIGISYAFLKRFQLKLSWERGLTDVEFLGYTNNTESYMASLYWDIWQKKKQD